MRSEAHRLADIIEQDPTTTWGYREASHAAAAELRRLHTERSAADEIISNLVEALKHLHDATWLISKGHYNQDLHDIAVSKARASIAKIEEQSCA
jgi:hypothetical protein